MGSFSGGSTGVTINSSEPVSPNSGEIWIDNSNEIMYQRNSTNDGWITLVKEPISDDLVCNNSNTIGDFTTPSSVTASGNATSTGTLLVWDTATRYNGVDATNSSLNDNSTGSYQTVTLGGNNTFEAVRWEMGATIENGTNITIRLAYLNYYNSGSAYAQISTDGTNWTSIGSFAISPTWPNFVSRTLNATISSDVKYVRVMGTSPNNQPLEFRMYYCQITGDIPDNANNTIDDDTGTKWSSGTSVANAYLAMDMGSATRTGQIAIYPHSDTTETELKIQSSADNITWSDLRTIQTSKLTNGQWNYIRFNSVTHQYFRIISNTGTNLAMAYNQVKVRTNISDTDISNSHTHGNISTSNTNIGLSG